MPPRFDEFKEWVSQPIEASTFHFHRAYWLATPDHSNHVPIERHATQTFAEAKGPVDITVDGTTKEILNIAWPRQLGTVILQDMAEDVVLDGICARRLRIKIRQDVTLKRCFIGHLEIEVAARLVLEDCYVSRLAFGSHGFDDLSLTDGLLMRIDGKAASRGGESPFKGRITVDGLYLPRSMEEVMDEHTKHDLAKLIYEYRNVRTYLAAKNDNLAAGVFHGAELALEREQDRWPTALVSWLYEVMADFGNSTVRPLGSLAIILTVMTAFAWLADAVKPSDAASLVGWQRSLDGTDAIERGFRSFVYSLQAIFNPLGLLNTKPLLIAKQPLHSILLTVGGLFGTFSVALFVLALRRRFKLD